MKKILLLAFQNMKKNRGQYISFGFIILLSAMLLHLGMITVMNYSDTFDEKSRTANTSDVFMNIAKSDLNDPLLDKIKNFEYTDSVETRDAIMLSGKIDTVNGEFNYSHVFYNMDQEHQQNILKTLEETDDAVKNPVYLSIWMKYNSGFDIGDTYSMDTQLGTIDLTVAGFVEDMQYGNYNLGIVAMYVPESTFKFLQNKVDSTFCYSTVNIKLTDSSKQKDMTSYIGDLVNGKTKYSASINNYDVIKVNRTMTSGIFTTLIISFAVIILAVSILVCNFRISNSIEEDMQNMGALKAIGYTGKQVLASVISPYMIVSTFMSVIGCLISYLVLPLLQTGLKMQTGFEWKQPFEILPLLICFVIINALILFMVFMFAKKIRKITTITALRGGIETHSFKKNRFEMENSHFGPNVLLALKGFVENIKRNVLLFIVLLAITFAAMFTMVMFYNINVDPDAFMNAMSEEIPSVTLKYTEGSGDELLKGISAMDNVDHCMFYDSINATCDSDNIPVMITDDYSKVANDICYSGRNPEHANEIAIGSSLSKEKDLTVGDKITFKYGDRTYEYLITGLLQSVNTNGMMSELTTEGAKHLSADYTPQQLFIYLEDKDGSAEFVDAVKAQYDSKITEYVDYVKTYQSAIKIYLSIINIFSIVMIVIMIVLILLIMYLIIKTVIVHQKQEYGILKSIGYTTKQLMLQMTLSFMPATVISTVLAGTLSFIFMNTAFGYIFRGLSIMKINFTVPFLGILIVAVAVCVVTFVISMLISNRIRKVTTYSLIKE